MSQQLTTEQFEIKKQLSIGSIITSVHDDPDNSEKIKIESIREYFITGRVVGYIFKSRADTDLRIVSFHNIKQIHAE